MSGVQPLSGLIEVPDPAPKLNQISLHCAVYGDLYRFISSSSRRPIVLLLAAEWKAHYFLGFADLVRILSHCSTVGPTAAVRVSLCIV